MWNFFFSRLRLTQNVPRHISHACSRRLRHLVVRFSFTLFKLWESVKWQAGKWKEKLVWFWDSFLRFTYRFFRFVFSHRTISDQMTLVLAAVTSLWKVSLRTIFGQMICKLPAIVAANFSKAFFWLRFEVGAFTLGFRWSTDASRFQTFSTLLALEFNQLVLSQRSEPAHFYDTLKNKRVFFSYHFDDIKNLISYLMNKHFLSSIFRNDEAETLQNIKPFTTSESDFAGQHIGIWVLFDCNRIKRKSL